MKKLLIMIISVIITTIFTLSYLLLMNNVAETAVEVTEVTQDILMDEIEVLTSGNNTVTEFKDMQSTLRNMNDRIADIFK